MERLEKETRFPDENVIGENEIGQLYRSYHDFQQLQHLYSAAVREVQMRLEVLNDEFNIMYARSPIHHIESRLKSTKSIVDKLKRKGLPISAAAARESINDMAGVRVVCGYIDDVYRVEELLMRQTDIRLVKRQDYIKHPNYNGYRSLHLDVRVPVFLSASTEYMQVAIQIRSVAMDFWASLEHDLRYKADKAALPEGINEEMLQCADEIAAIDRKMQEMYRRIHAVK